MGPAEDQQEGGRGAVALADEVGLGPEGPDPALTENLLGRLSRAAQRRADDFEIGNFGQINLRKSAPDADYGIEARPRQPFNAPAATGALSVPIGAAPGLVLIRVAGGWERKARRLRPGAFDGCRAPASMS